MQLNPGSWEVRNNLALLLKLLGERQIAEQCLLEALELKPDYFDALNNLGNLYCDLQRFGAARSCFDAALQLRPDSAQVLTNLGLLYKEQGQIAEAIEVYRRAVALADYPLELPYNYAIALIQSGQYQQGYAWYEQRWLMPDLSARRQVYDAAMREWNGEFLGGKTLVVWNEQGLGDMIQMARYLPLWKAAHPDCRLLLRVEPSLRRLLRALPGVDLLCTSDEPMPDADFHLSAMSLPFRLHTELSHIPARDGYLRVDAALVAAWAARLGPRQGRARVGLVWQSGTPGVGKPARDRLTRSLATDSLQQLLQIPSVEWINLQVGGEELAAHLAGQMRSPGAAIADFADSAAILSQLDALVAVDTAAAHLGGALGIPTFVMMRRTGGNLFPAQGADMPWYRSMTLLRQQTLYDWEPVIDELRQRLSAQISAEG